MLLPSFSTSLVNPANSGVWNGREQWRAEGEGDEAVAPRIHLIFFGGGHLIEKCVFERQLWVGRGGGGHPIKEFHRRWL